MSDDFTPSPRRLTPGTARYPYEDGGNRDHSDSKDWRINTKVGITPNATDEYTINYTNTEQEELPAPRRPPDRAGLFLRPTRASGTWPSGIRRRCRGCRKRKLGEPRTSRPTPTTTPSRTWSASIDDHRTYTTHSRRQPLRGTSYGGFVEMGTDLIPMNTLKGAIHYRQRRHTERDIDYADTNTSRHERRPRRSAEEAGRSPSRTRSTPRAISISLSGVSYDTNKVRSAESELGNAAVSHPTRTSMPGTGRRPQSTAIAAPARCTPTSRAAPASRRCSTATAPASARGPDPNLTPERATNYEVGISDTIPRRAGLVGRVLFGSSRTPSRTIRLRLRRHLAPRHQPQRPVLWLRISADWEPHAGSGWAAITPI